MGAPPTTGFGVPAPSCDGKGAAHRSRQWSGGAVGPLSPPHDPSRRRRYWSSGWSLPIVVRTGAMI